MIPASNKLQYVQVLRGLAALYVLFFHCSLNSFEYFHIKPILSGIWDYGFTGVEFFFILSGFIITYVHLKDLETKSGWPRFLRKRFTRIYPIYWVVATIMLFYYLFIKKEAQGITVQITGPGDLLYLLKCYLLFPMSASHKNFIDVAWTLSYEVWFYLVFACCIVLGFRRSKWIYFIWAGLIVFKTYTHIGDFSPVLNFILNPMILYFLAGCTIAWIVRKEKLRWKPVHLLLVLSIVSILLITYARLSGSPLSESRHDLNYYYFLMALFGVLLWLAAHIDLHTGIASPPKWFLLIGDASYSIYLLHPAIVMLSYKIAVYALNSFSITPTSLTTNLVFLAAVLASLLAGIVLHLLIEKPLLVFLNKEKNRRFILKPVAVKKDQ